MADSLKKQVGITVLTASLSLVAGFFVVYLLVGPSGSEEMEEDLEEAGKSVQTESTPHEKTGGEATKGTPLNVENVQSTQEEEKGSGETGSGAEESAEEGAEEKEPAVEQASAGEEKAAAGTAGVVSLNSYFIFRCWREGEDAAEEKEACGMLADGEGLVRDHLDAIGKCVKEFSGKDQGKISLALKIDFSKKRYRAWLGQSTTIQGVEETSACIRQFYSDIPFKDGEHSFNKYLVFYNLTKN